MGRLLTIAACMAVVVLVAAPPMIEAITCGQVETNLAPCISYLKNGSAPPPPCCNGVRSTVNSAGTMRDHQAVCNCLKVAAGKVPGVKSQFADALPPACKVFIPYKISLLVHRLRQHKVLKTEEGDDAWLLKPL